MPIFVIYILLIFNINFVKKLFGNFLIEGFSLHFGIKVFINPYAPISDFGIYKTHSITHSLNAEEIES